MCLIGIRLLMKHVMVELSANYLFHLLPNRVLQRWDLRFVKFCSLSLQTWACLPRPTMNWAHEDNKSPVSSLSYLYWMNKAASRTGVSFVLLEVSALRAGYFHIQLWLWECLSLRRGRMQTFQNMVCEKNVWFSVSISIEEIATLCFNQMINFL